MYTRLPSLKFNNIYISDVTNGGLVYSNLFGPNSQFESMRYEYKLPVPMQSLLVEYQG